MRVWRLALVLLLVLSASPAAWCAGLATADVEGFIGAMQDLKPYFDAYAAEAGDDGDATSMAGIMGDWAGSLGQQQELKGILGKHGFNFETWPLVAQQVTQAYLAVKLGADGEDVLGQMRQSMAEIESSKDIPAEYRSQMLEQMKQSLAEMEETLAASPDSQEVVRPFLPQLDSVFGWQE
jgi:hypothetical protein